MKSVYRYRQERHFAKPPAAIWPFVSDSARIMVLILCRRILSML
jgi:hypothetical protein